MAGAAVVVAGCAGENASRVRQEAMMGTAATAQQVVKPVTPRVAVAPVAVDETRKIRDMLGGMVAWVEKYQVKGRTVPVPAVAGQAEVYQEYVVKALVRLPELGVKGDELGRVQVVVYGLLQHMALMRGMGAEAVAYGERKAVAMEGAVR
ncbi:MAG: hypothetical protein WAZ18_05925 [Alphaproteobacteria bacterium]